MAGRGDRGRGTCGKGGVGGKGANVITNRCGDGRAWGADTALAVPNTVPQHVPWHRGFNPLVTNSWGLRDAVIS